jgi:hypothetical protein
MVPKKPETGEEIGISYVFLSAFEGGIGVVGILVIYQLLEVQNLLWSTPKGANLELQRPTENREQARQSRCGRSNG